MRLISTERDCRTNSSSRRGTKVDKKQSISRKDAKTPRKNREPEEILFAAWRPGASSMKILFQPAHGADHWLLKRVTLTQFDKRRSVMANERSSVPICVHLWFHSRFSRSVMRISLVFILLVLLMSSSVEAYAEETDWDVLLERLRADNIPGNASRALRELDPRWGRQPKLHEIVDRLKVLARDPDSQMRQYASYLLVQADPATLAPESLWRSDLLELFAGALRADDVSHNASHSRRVFRHLIWGENPADIRDLLAPLLTDPDYQARQLATYLTVDSYRQAGIPESEWPQLVFENMVMGLRDDAIRGRRGGIANARILFGFLFDLKENRPIDLLRRELAGDDTQSQYAAAVLLARWGDLQSGHKIRTLLTPHLVDDGGLARAARNAITAYQALVWYGPDNTAELLREFHPTDWQDGALVLCMAAFHDLLPSFVTDAHRQEWLSKIEEYESGQYRRLRADMKIAAAALYLDPGAKPFLNGKKTPAHLQRMLAAGKGVRELPERAKWMVSWFPMLDPYSRGRASSVISMGRTG
jgi:hypothetical protein